MSVRCDVKAYDEGQGGFARPSGSTEYRHFSCGKATQVSIDVPDASRDESLIAAPGLLHSIERLTQCPGEGDARPLQIKVIVRSLHDVSHAMCRL